MTGIQRLRELADDMFAHDLWDSIREGIEDKYGVTMWDDKTVNGLLRDIADQIEDEQEERVTRRVEDREAAGWVRAHGGLDAVRAKWRSMIPRARVEHMAERQRERLERIAALNKAVDEMRPRLMPEGMEWLRYDTGEPVPLGGEVTVTVHNEDGDFDRTLAIRSIKYQEDGVLLEGTENETVILCHGERVKRPAPKVLDADGAEIRVGDHVWNEVGTAFTAIAVDVKNKSFKAMRHFDGQECEGLNPAIFTHRAPVFAADGKPLRKGETVYGIGWTKHRFVVRAASDYEEDEPDGRFCVPCIDKDDGDEECWCDPSQLTHTKPELPDSWERLAEDATVSPEAYCAKRGIDFSDVDGQHRVLDEVTERMARDLVRRARALAGRDAS